MSIIRTCYVANVNAFEYLTTIQKHWLEVKENPELWLPWNYRDSLRAIGGK